MTEPRAVLRTARLRLRPFRPDDLPAYTAIRADSETARYLPGGAAAAAEASERARRTIGAWGESAWQGGGAVDPRLAPDGARMMVHHYDGCRTCRGCLSGWTQLCEKGSIVYGRTGDGAHARW